MHEGENALADMEGTDREGEMEREKQSGDQMRGPDKKRSER